MVHSMSRGDRRGFRVLDKQMRPVLSIKEVTARKLAKPWLFKKDDKNHYTLNLSSIRSLSRNCWVNREYQKRLQKK